MKSLVSHLKQKWNDKLNSKEQKTRTNRLRRNRGGRTRTRHSTCTKCCRAGQMSSGATMWRYRRLWNLQNHLAWHLIMKKENVNNKHGRVTSERIVLVLGLKHAFLTENFVFWKICFRKATSESWLSWVSIFFKARVDTLSSLQYGLCQWQRHVTLDACVHKSQSGNFSVSPTSCHSINNSLVSLSLRSTEHVFSRWGWGDSGQCSNERGGIPQPRVNNFSNFRYAENPKQRDKIDNWSVILWN